MDVILLTDQYEAAAPLYGKTPEELRARDAHRPGWRWLARRDGQAVGAVLAQERPDLRTFLSYAGDDLAALRPLTEAAARHLGGRLHTMADEAECGRLAALRTAGFETEMVSERFVIPFERAIAAVDRAWVPSGMSIRPADEVDEDRLFTLDNTLRQDVPGSDGWRGDRQWFREELAESPPFDPSAYLVGMDDRNGEYAALLRIWRNPDGPRLGLIGVVRQYRNTTIAAALLRQGLRAAAGWGHEHLVTETSPDNPVTYQRMARLGAESRGRFLQLVRR